MAKTKKAEVSKPLTKSDTYQALAEATQLTRKQVASVFDAMSTLIKKELGKKGIFTIPGLLKLKRVRKPAVKGGEQKMNPFTKEMMVTKSRPARNDVRARPLKSLKEMIN